jgi:hypothetical protein
MRYVVNWGGKHVIWTVKSMCQKDPNGQATDQIGVY